MAFLLLCLRAGAQVLTMNGVDVAVQPGAQLTVKGDVLASAGATIVNAGTVDLSGDLANNSGGALFTAVQGGVVMNGTAQIISGSSATAFDGLDLQCTSLTLQQDAIVGGAYASPSGVLQLRDAIVQLNTHRLTVSNALPAAITRNTGQIVSESDPLSGYGEVQWNIGANAGNYVVPFGTGATFLPVTLNIGTVGTGAGGFVFATYPTDPTTAPNNRPLPGGMVWFTDVAGNENAPHVLDRFWPITAQGYTTTPTASLTFTYRDSEWNTGTNTIAEGALQAQHFNGTQWSQPPNGVINTAQNTLVTTNTNSFDFVWALSESNASLPVELLFFNAEPNDHEVLCTWATATEIDNDHFTVERSADGEVFTDIGEVDGAGTSQTMLAYAFVDDAPLSGLSYYRLRQTDIDGNEVRTATVAVWMGIPADDLVVFPNPCSSLLFIAGQLAPMDRVSILDMTGKRIASQDPDGNGAIDISMLPGGTYALEVSSQSARRTVRFIKQ